MYRLTPIGADFRRRGHRMADDEVTTTDIAKLVSVNTMLRVHDSNAGGRPSTGTADYVLDSQGSAVGVYAYKGKGVVSSASGPTWENTFHRVGGFGQYVNGPLNLSGAVTTGEEQITSAGLKTDNLGGLVEADLSVCDRVAVFGRYDYFDPNRDTGRPPKRPGDWCHGRLYGARMRGVRVPQTGPVASERCNKTLGISARSRLHVLTSHE